MCAERTVMVLWSIENLMTQSLNASWRLSSLEQKFWLIQWLGVGVQLAFRAQKPEKTMSSMPPMVLRIKELFNTKCQLLPPPTWETHHIVPWEFRFDTILFNNQLLNTYHGPDTVLGLSAMQKWTRLKATLGNAQSTGERWYKTHWLYYREMTALVEYTRNIQGFQGEPLIQWGLPKHLNQVWIIGKCFQEQITPKMHACEVFISSQVWTGCRHCATCWDYSTEQDRYFPDFKEHMF